MTLGTVVGPDKVDGLMSTVEAGSSEASCFLSAELKL